MPSFLHKTLRRSTYLLNVLEGCWLPNIQNTQFIFNYGTSFEIFKFIPPNLLEPIYSQPFFDRVCFICSGPQTSEISFFYALRENDIIEYKYQELEGFFVATNKFNLPLACIRPTFAAYAQSHLIVSSTNGSICSIDLSNGEIKNIKPSECVLHTFLYSSKQFLFRIELGPKISIYSIPEISLSKATNLKNIKYAFPYRDSSYVLFQPNDTLSNKSTNNSSSEYDLSESDDPSPCFTIISPNEQEVLIDYPSSINTNENVIDHAVISSTSTIILTENGHLLQLVNDKFEYIGNYPHSYRIFALNATEILIARHGLDHIVLDLLYKSIACEQESFSSILNFTIIPSFNDDKNINESNLVTMTNSSFSITKYGIEVEELSSFDILEDEISGIFSFIHIILKTTMYAVSFARGVTQILELSEDNNKLIVSQNPIIRTDVCTIGICSLDPYFIFQFYKDGFAIYSQKNQRFEELKNSTIIGFTSTKNELICSFSDQTAFYAVSDNSELRISKHFNLPIVATSISIIEGTEYAIFASNDMTLYIANLTREIDLIRFTLFSKVPSIPVSLYYTNKNKLLIGFEDGIVAAGIVDLEFKMLRDTVLISIGNSPVHFTFDEFAISSRMFLISDENDIFDMFPLNNNVNPEFAVKMNSPDDQYLMATKHKIYAMKIKGRKPKMESVRFKIESKILECIPMHLNTNLLIASNQDVSILNLNDMSITQLFQYDECKKFILMTPIDDDKNKICFATYFYQVSNIQVINFDDEKIGDFHISFDLNISGKVGAVCGFKGGILIGVDNSILFYKKNQDDGLYCILSRTSEIGTEIVSIIANNDFIFVGDRLLSVLILEYVESFQNFRIVGQEPVFRRVLSMAQYKSSVVGGDLEGNIFTYDELSKIFSDLSASFSMFKGNRRLPLKMCYNVGEVVTKVQSVNDNEKKMMQITYSTINGSFGAFLEKEKNSPFSYKMNLEEKFKTLLSLQTIIEEQLFKLSAIDHFAFRNKLYPSEVVLDLDLINMYLNFSENKKERVAKEISSSFSAHQIEILIRSANQLFCSIC